MSGVKKQGIEDLRYQRRGDAAPDNHWSDKRTALGIAQLACPKNSAPIFWAMTKVGAVNGGKRSLVLAGWD